MKPAGVLVALALVMPVTSPAQNLPARDARKAADAFRLDLGPLPADDAVTAISTSSPAPSEAFTLDTPIDRLIADARARAVLDRNLPGLSTDENLPRFRSLSLRAFQPLTGGQLTDDLLGRMAADLAALPSARARKSRFDSR